MTYGATMERIRGLLDADHVDKALHLAHKFKDDPEMKNAVAVCHLRQGHPDQAIGIYRGMTLGPGGLNFKPDVPDKYKVNFATALLMTGNVSGCRSMLRELQDRTCPAAVRLQAALDRWKKTLSFWQRINLAFGGEPNRSAELDFPPGEV